VSSTSIGSGENNRNTAGLSKNIRLLTRFDKPKTIHTMPTSTFAPELFIPNGVTNIDFYTKGLGAVELRRFSNDDGSIHVAELSIDGAVFHLHEETTNPLAFSPARHEGTTVLIGLFVSDVDYFMEMAVAAGAKVTSPAQDYDYGYRQGAIEDPFGHSWMFEKALS
jgi:PhnB protein